MAHELSAGPRASRYTSRGGLFERPLLTFRMKEASMLGIVLLYVGIVLISNGCYGLLGIEDKSNVVMNLFTGGLGLVLNIIAIGIGVARGRRLVVLRKRHRPAVCVYLPLYRPQHHLRLRQAPLWHLQSLCCHQHHPGWSPVHYAGLRRQLDLRTHLVGVGHPVAHRLHRDKPQEAAGQVRGGTWALSRELSRLGFPVSSCSCACGRRSFALLWCRGTAGLGFSAGFTRTVGTSAK